MGQGNEEAAVKGRPQKANLSANRLIGRCLDNGMRNTNQNYNSKALAFEWFLPKNEGIISTEELPGIGAEGNS